MRIWVGVYLSLGLLGAGCASQPKNPWRDVRATWAGPSEAIGYYSKGCLKGAQSLYPQGEGYQVMRISRRRFYGHPHLIQFIEGLGRTISRKKLGTLLIGDLGQPRGGPTLSGHVSHQSGLDVDIWFWQPPQKLLSLDERENLDAPSVVKGEGLDPRLWSARQVRILKLAAENPEVERILVNPIIKRAICEDPKNHKWHQKIRAWWGHDDHFHVRLRCPADSPLCTPQEAVQDDGSCDQVFMDEWFSEEARVRAAERAKMESAPPEMPELPEACTELIYRLQ